MSAVPYLGPKSQSPQKYSRYFPWRVLSATFPLRSSLRLHLFLSNSIQNSLYCSCNDKLRYHQRGHEAQSLSFPPLYCRMWRMVRHTSVIGWIYVPRSSTVDYGTLAGRLVALSLACGQPTMAHCGPPPHPPPTNPLLSSRGVQLYWASLLSH